MKRQTTIIFTLILTTFFSCKNDRKSPEAKTPSEYKNTQVIPTEAKALSEKNTQFIQTKVKTLSEYKKTQFIPTLEHRISNGKNAVYCATLLLAWDKIRKQINSPLTISDKYFDLKLLNQSTSFENVLDSNEYKVTGKLVGNLISALAELNKSLPFELKLQSIKNRLTFDGQKVSSFGIYSYDNYQQLEIVKIIYYKNDNNFIIALLPKDDEHEIILFKTDQRFKSIADMTKEIDRLTEIGKTEKGNEKINWKYFYNKEDVVIIPKFNFNIETNYSSLEGNDFKSTKQSFQVVQAWQRTAFILDDKGAEIESEAKMAVKGMEESMRKEYEKPKPKKMIFDKPFLILLKRTDAKNPYFGLWITNTELMTEE